MPSTWEALGKCQRLLLTVFSEIPPPRPQCGSESALSLNSGPCEGENELVCLQD